MSINVLGISGSLRRESFNTMLLRSAVELAPSDLEIEIYDGLRGLPPYDADDDGESPPEPVADLRARIDAADGLLVVTPEYNYSIPGALKNAIDWASRPKLSSVLKHKPVAIMGAAPGNFGTVRAQLALRQVFLWTESLPVVRPEVHVFLAAQRFDEAGRLTDPTSREMVGDLLVSLQSTIEQRRAIVAG